MMIGTPMDLYFFSLKLLSLSEISLSGQANINFKKQKIKHTQKKLTEHRRQLIANRAHSNFLGRCSPSSNCTVGNKWKFFGEGAEGESRG